MKQCIYTVRESLEHSLSGIQSVLFASLTWSEAEKFMDESAHAERSVRPIGVDLDVVAKDVWSRLNPIERLAIERVDCCLWIGPKQQEAPAPAVEEKPKPIVAMAAIKDCFETVWSVPRPGRHHNVIEYMRRSGYIGPVSKEGQQGFILSDGRFCTRKAAMSVAEEAGQLKNGKIIGSQLTTEDLW